MSAIARWSYKNKAFVRPFLGQDEWGGGKSYGEAYQIACNWAAIQMQERNVGGESGSLGVERILKHEVYTEDDRPKYLDLISLGDSDEWEEIRQKTGWDMALFNDTMDFKLLTG